MTLLEVSNLHVRLQTHRGPADAVRGVGFSLARGETLGLIGESGCGKSLTAMSLMGLLPDSAEVSGSIRFDGEEIVGRTDAQMCKLRGNRIGMVFQEPMTALNPVHTIGHQVAEPLRLHRGLNAAAARAEAIVLLDRVGIPGAAQRLDAYPHQFSGGQRQRITIAMALACGPDLLIADEPTTALDVTIQAQILELMKKLQDEIGMSILFITHNLGVVAEMADRVVVMYGGRAVEEADVVTTFKKPLMPYTMGLLNSIPRLDRAAEHKERLEAIPGNVPNPLYMPAGCAFHPRCKYFQAGRCDQEIPPLEDAGGGHMVRCVRWAEIQQEVLA